MDSKQTILSRIDWPINLAHTYSIYCMRFITKPNFINERDVALIKLFKRPETQEIKNEHIRAVNEQSLGWTSMYDFSKTDLTRELSQFQGDGTCIDSVPDYYRELGLRIASELNISSDNMYFQYISLGAGGQVKQHYDAGKPGYVTYKCNICVEGPDHDVINVHKHEMNIEPRSLYCFEANLYKHWMEASDTPRIHLSYGFILPYADLGWDEESPRIRMSNKIWKAYMGEMNGKQETC